MKSNILERGPVTFPEYTGERVYMHPFTKAAGLPLKLSRWQLTVDAMLAGVDTEGLIYLMIDQAPVVAGNPHRRGGPHIDGNWCAVDGQHDTHCANLVSAHGAGSGGRWFPSPPRPVHRPSGAHNSMTGFWRAEDFSPEALILASDVAACAAYVGEVGGDPKEGGDCSHLDLSGLDRVLLKPNRVYSGNVTCIHESLPINRDCVRTLVRLNVPTVEI